jgi:prolyl-tRNA synthetase
MSRVSTPARKTIEEVALFLETAPECLVKTLILQTDGGENLAVLLRGDRELNEIKLCRLLGCNDVELASEETVIRVTGAPSGFAGPVGLSLRILADHEVAGMADFICGANEKDLHLAGVNLGRDFSVEALADLRQAVAGDPCPRCAGKLESWRGIEVGHVFKLGTKYSKALNATVLDDQGQERLLIMGCYGIGVGRTVAAAIEQNHDENGIIFPMPIAPFQVLVTMVNPNDEAVNAAAVDLYRALQDSGVEVLLDDRDERPGSKFKDADLIGIPLRVTVGARGLKEGALELQERRGGERTMLPLAEAAGLLVESVRKGLR